MPLGNLIANVQTLVNNSQQLVNNLPDVGLSEDSCRSLRELLLRFYPNGVECKKHFFQVTTDRQLRIVCPNQYLLLTSISRDCATILKNYFDFLHGSIENEYAALVNDLQREFADRAKKFDDATEEILGEIDAWLTNHNCSAYIEHCRECPEDRLSLCFFLAAFGVKNFREGNGFRQEKDLFKAYILSIIPLQSESAGFLGYFVYNLITQAEFFDRLTAIVNQDNAEVVATSVRQIILYGAPGTGKSYKIDDTERGYGLRTVDKEFKFRTTFHPDYDYAQFVGSYKPVETPTIPILNRDDLSRELRRFMAEERPNPVHKFAARYFKSLKRLLAEEKRALFDEAAIPESVQSTEVPKAISIAGFLDKKNNSSSITYSFVPQVFAKAYVKAWTEYLIAIAQDQNAIGEKVYLVIEEINRGNCAQIFGDIFQLLDRKEGRSDYPIDVDADFAKYIEEQLSNVRLADGTIVNYWNDYKNKIQTWDSPEQGEGSADNVFCKIALPPNFNILATMNTSDQSLFPMDSAFKRRFDWEYVPIKDERDDTCGAEWNADLYKIMTTEYDWLAFLKGVNENIFKVTRSEDKQMGEFFIKPKSADNIITLEEFRSKVLFYLWDSIYKDEMDNSDAKIFKFKKRVNGQNVVVKYSFQDLYKGLITDQENRVRDIVMNAIEMARSQPDDVLVEEPNPA